MFVGAVVPHYTDGLHRKQHSERLPDKVVQSRAADFFEVYGVGLAQDLELLCGERARNPDRQARSREGMAPDEALPQAQLASQSAHLLLEESAQRPAPLPIHAIRK